jgi:di/tricarboxylate transporter
MCTFGRLFVMTWEAWYTLAVIAICFFALSLTQLAADVVMVGGVLLLAAAGVVTTNEALLGLSNEGVATIAVLYVVTSGLQQTGAMNSILPKLLGRPGSIKQAQLRLMVPVAVASAFLNNTPLVAMLIGAVGDWAKKNAMPMSRLMIPLSYAAIVGGTTTLIGTSTNLVVNGLLIKETGRELGMFEIGVIGVPVAVAVIALLVLFGRWLLPDRQPASAALENPRSYVVEMLVEANGLLVGQSIEAAGLRHLPGLYLMEVERGERRLPAVSPQERLQAGDRLIFTGVVESVVDLHKMRGLKPATDQIFKLDGHGDHHLVEAVVSDSCPLVGRSIRDGRFRSVYNAAVIAVARNGDHIQQKIGDIVLRAGDTLMLLTHTGFAEQQRNSRDFYLVGKLEDSQAPAHHKARIALFILLAMVVAVTAGWSAMLPAAMIAAAGMLLLRCTTANVARKSIDWQVLITIAATLALGGALEKTGAAAEIAHSLTVIGSGDPWLALVAIYVVTVVFTELITNNAAAALMFPIAVATAKILGVDLMPFVVAILFAASASFATPIGYQTNLMVYGPGGYRFTDYFRAGIPLTFAVGLITCGLIPYFWKF